MVQNNLNFSLDVVRELHKLSYLAFIFGFQVRVDPPTLLQNVRIRTPPSTGKRPGGWLVSKFAESSYFHPKVRLFIPNGT